MSIRVAIVEDDERLRGSLAILLGGSSGFELVGTCPDAESALTNLPVIAPDVVLMDINLPGLSGIECTRNLKRVLPRIHIIMVTAYLDDESVFEALRAGAVGYLAKQTEAWEILQAIHEVQHGGSPMSSAIARRVVTHFQRGKPEAPARVGAPKPHLSPREEEIVQLLVKGCRYKEVAEELQCSVNTVREHLRRIYEKLQVTSAREAVVKFLRSGSADGRSTR